MRYFFPFLLGSLLSINLYGQAPTGLMTDLVEHTEQIFLGGYPSSVLSEASSHRFGPSGGGIARTAVISGKRQSKITSCVILSPRKT